MSADLFRSLCAELLQPLSEYDDANPYHEHCSLITRARAELAKPELAPTDEELLAMRSWSCHGPTFDSDLVDFGHRCYNLGRYGTPAIQPVAVTPTDEELPMPAAIRDMPEQQQRWYALGWRAALARYGTPAIQPVPASEQWPGPEDCDEQGRCWWFTPADGNPGPFRSGDWSLYAGWRQKYTHWLPANALPTPEATNV
jgi:hypothetical protein